LSQRRGNARWIDPLLTGLNLVRKREQDSDRINFWKQIEDSELADRVGRLVAEINAAAGYHVLEMLDFLPPQKNVLRISFERKRVKYNLEIAIRDYGIVLMFSRTRRVLTGWEHYIPGHSMWEHYIPRHSMRDSSTLVWEQVIHPAEVVEPNIQAWLSYLVSGFDEKLRLDQILSASSEAEGSASLRKASA
jgi:hypothetical protein